MDGEKKARLDGKVAIVTGSGRGLGRAQALALARAGAKLVVNDAGVAVSGLGEREPVAEAVVDEIRALGGEAVANIDSIADTNGAKALVATAMDQFGRIDILVNNAGIARPSPIYKMAEEDWDAVIAVHLKGHFGMIRHASPVMIKQRSGVIINIASNSGQGHYGMSNYSAAKEGIVGFTRTVARDLGEFGIRCNALRPQGWTRLGTPEVSETIRYSQEVLGIPGNGNMWIAEEADFPTPEPVGLFVAWLCTDATANVTGRTFYVRGGIIGIYPEPELDRTVANPTGWTLDTLDAQGRELLIGDIRNPFEGKVRPLDVG